MMKDRDRRFQRCRTLKSEPTTPIEKDQSPLDFRRVLSGR